MGGKGVGDAVEEEDGFGDVAEVKEDGVVVDETDTELTWETYIVTVVEAAVVVDTDAPEEAEAARPAMEK